MPVTDDLRAIAERANRDLDAVHDFFEHSKIVWRSFRVMVEEGHKVSAHNLATGNAIDQDGLLRLASHYTRDYLAAFTFRQFVSTFEVFLFDFLHRLFLHNPWQFAGKQLAFDLVLKAKDREEIVSGLLRKQLNELKYENPRAWFDALNKTIKLDCPTEDEIAQFVEVKATRDLLEHNANVVNEIYLHKAAKKARYGVGEPADIDDNYHLDSWRLLKKIAADISAAALARLPSPAT